MEYWLTISSVIASHLGWAVEIRWKRQKPVACAGRRGSARCGGRQSNTSKLRDVVGWVWGERRPHTAALYRTHQFEPSTSSRNWGGSTPTSPSSSTCSRRTSRSPLSEQNNRAWEHLRKIPLITNSTKEHCTLSFSLLMMHPSYALIPRFATIYPTYELHFGFLIFIVGEWYYDMLELLWKSRQQILKVDESSLIAGRRPYSPPH